MTIRSHFKIHSQFFGNPVCSEFLNISKIEDPPISFADVERSQYQDVWNDSVYAEFSGLWNSNAIKHLKSGELQRNANVECF